MKNLGFNYRITDFQCALGISQLAKIKKFINERRQIATYYNKQFKNLENIKIPEEPANFKSSYHLYALRINFKKIGLNKNTFFKRLIKKGIKLQVHYVPIYRHSYYKKKFKINYNQFFNTEVFLQKCCFNSNLLQFKEKNTKKNCKIYKILFVQINFSL